MNEHTNTPTESPVSAAAAPDQQAAPQDAPLRQGAGDERTSFLLNIDVDAIRDQAHSLGRQILNTLRDGFGSKLGLTAEEQGIAARAAEEVAVCSILAIGAPAPLQERLAVRAQRAQSTLVQLYVGEKVETQAAVRDAIAHVVRTVIQAAIGILTKTVAA